MATLLRPANRPFLTRAFAHAVGLLPTSLRRRRLRSAAAAQNVEVHERTRVMPHPTLRTSDTVVVLWWTR
jgi:hypothetical protein